MTERREIRGNRRTRRKKRKSIWRVLLSVMTLLLLTAVVLTIWMLKELTGGVSLFSGMEKALGKIEAAAGEGSPEGEKPIELKDLYSQRGILIRRETGEVLGEKKADEQMEPASMTKIMTVLTALDYLGDLEETAVMPQDLYSPLYQEGASMAGFLPGETVTCRELLYGAMLPSGAECCQMLARIVAGDEESFVRLMNEKAQDLNLTGTHFENSTGLHGETHYSTVRDIASLLLYALKNETFSAVFTAESYSTPPLESHPDGITLRSTLREEMEKAGISEEGILGGKTGYTSQAGLCLASLLSVGGEEYILVTAKAEGNHETQPYHILDAVSVCEKLRR